MRKIILIFLILKTWNIHANPTGISPDLYYNMGNKAFEEGKYDQAIYNYELAKLLEPHSRDIQNNLKVAVEKLPVDIVELKPFFLYRWWTSFAGWMLPGYWKILTVLFSFLGLYALYRWMLRSEGNPQKWKVWTWATTLLAILTISAGTFRERQIFENPYGIVMGGDTDLHLGPDQVSEKILKVTGGVKVKILDRSRDWYKVSTLDKTHGWIPVEKVKRIQINQS